MGLFDVLRNRFMCRRYLVYLSPTETIILPLPEGYRCIVEQRDKGCCAYSVYDLEGGLVHQTFVGENKNINIDCLSKYLCDEGYVYAGNSETASQHRNKGIYKAVLNQINRDYIARSRVIITTETGNNASIKGIENAGYECVATGEFSRFGPAVSWKLIDEL